MFRKNSFPMFFLLILTCFSPLFLEKVSLYAEIPLDGISNKIDPSQENTVDHDGWMDPMLVIDDQELHSLDSTLKKHKNSHDLSNRHTKRTHCCKGPTGPAGPTGPQGTPGEPGSVPLLGYASFYSESSQNLQQNNFIAFEITGVNNGAIFIPSQPPGAFKVATGFGGDYFIQFSLNFFPNFTGTSNPVFALLRVFPPSLIYPNSNITFTIGELGNVATYGFYATLNEGDLISLINNSSTPATITPVNTGNISAAILFKQLQ